jgi:hypothetical protein
MGIFLMGVRRCRIEVLPDDQGEMDGARHVIGLGGGRLMDLRASESADPVWIYNRCQRLLRAYPPSVVNGER